MCTISLLYIYIYIYIYGGTRINFDNFTLLCGRVDFSLFLDCHDLALSHLSNNILVL